MSPAHISSEPPVATTEELRQAALRRAQRRARWVARRRLWWRWTVWALGQIGRWLLPPLLLALAVAWWLRWPASLFGPQAVTPVPGSAQPAAERAPAPAMAASEPDISPLQLRLDAESPQTRGVTRNRPYTRPSSETAAPAAAGSAPPQESP